MSGHRLFQAFVSIIRASGICRQGFAPSSIFFRNGVKVQRSPEYRASLTFRNKALERAELLLVMPRGLELRNNLADPARPATRNPGVYLDCPNFSASVVVPSVWKWAVDPIRGAVESAGASSMRTLSAVRVKT